MDAVHDACAPRARRFDRSRFTPRRLPGLLALLMTLQPLAATASARSPGTTESQHAAARARLAGMETQFRWMLERQRTHPSHGGAARLKAMKDALDAQRARVARLPVPPKEPAKKKPRPRKKVKRIVCKIGGEGREETVERWVREKERRARRARRREAARDREVADLEARIAELERQRVQGQPGQVPVAAPRASRGNRDTALLGVAAVAAVVALVAASSSGGLLHGGQRHHWDGYQRVAWDRRRDAWSGWNTRAQNPYYGVGAASRAACGSYGARHPRDLRYVCNGSTWVLAGDPRAGTRVDAWGRRVDGYGRVISSADNTPYTRPDYRTASAVPGTGLWGGALR